MSLIAMNKGPRDLLFALFVSLANVVDFESFLVEQC